MLAKLTADLVEVVWVNSVFLVVVLTAGHFLNSFLETVECSGAIRIL